MFKADRDAAGIPARDDAGRVADFHALRHTFITNLATGGVAPKTAQALARHSTITLTLDRYTHQYKGDEAAALDVLPDLSAPPAEAVALLGTDDSAATADDTPTSSPTSSSAKSRPSGASRCDEVEGEARREAGRVDAANVNESGDLREVAQHDAKENGEGGILWTARRDTFVEILVTRKTSDLRHFLGGAERASLSAISWKRALDFHKTSTRWRHYSACRQPSLAVY